MCSSSNPAPFLEQPYSCANLPQPLVFTRMGLGSTAACQNVNLDELQEVPNPLESQESTCDCRYLVSVASYPSRRGYPPFPRPQLESPRGYISKISSRYPTVPDGTRSYAMVPGSRITSRVPSSEIQAFLTIFCAVFVVSDGTRRYATVPERALDHFADVLAWMTSLGKLVSPR